MDHFTRDGLTFDVEDSGGEGVPVVLLHGWPASPRSWDAVVPQLTAAGHRVVVPAQRGYSPGARPSGRSAYKVTELVGDVTALIDELGGRAHVVGHDWGAIVAWGVAGRSPERVVSLTAVSVAHPRAFVRSLLGSQALQSWYMAFFQLPRIPEALLVGRGGRFGRQALRRAGLPADVAATYIAGLSGPGAMRAALNWYRALPLDLDMVGRIQPPTLMVWSDEDVALGRSAVDHTGSWVDGPYRLEILKGAGHWIPECEAARFGPMLVEHIAAHP